jgi:hypothetical protein
MENKRITKEMREELRKPLPDEAVTQHPTKTFLSSIKAIYVVERLNEVFGVGSWSIKTDVVDNKTSMIVVKSIVEIPEYGVYLESFGGNNNGGENSKNFDLGDAYKGASTDSLTKIASFLEIGIDVFKGKHAPKGKASEPKEGEPTNWLNKGTEEFNIVRTAILSGKRTIEDARKKYKISKEVAELLTEPEKVTA